MSKVRVPVFGTVGRAVIFDPQAGARAEAAVAALAAQIAAGTGSNIFHRNLQNLQVGDDHPQYTMWQAPETIAATWNFQAEPDIEGIPLTEFIEDVVGNELVQDSTSISWTYGDTANTLQAHIIDEYVQDLVGAMLLDTTSIDLAYNDGTGKITASIIDEYVQDLVGAMLTDSTSIDFTYNDAAGTFTAAIIDEYVQDLVGTMATDSTSIDFTYNDGAGTFTAAVIDEYIQDLVGTMATDSTSIDFTYNDGAGTLTAATINANPTGTIGLSAVNGSAATPMRSDGAPALSQAIAPTWTDVHVFGRAFASEVGSLAITNTSPVLEFNKSDNATDKKRWLWLAGSQGDLFFQARSDSGGGSNPSPLRLTRDGGVGLIDGVSTPATTAGWALLYVDTADGDLKVKFGDGTIKTIVTD